MDRSLTQSDSATRRHIMSAALKTFAHRGYAAASVQEIVDAAQVSKPALYYYFEDKAGLFRALVENAHEERFRLMREAAAKHEDLRSKLIEILSAFFEFAKENRELLTIAFATPFAFPGELPANLCTRPKCQRNLEFLESLMVAGLKRKELNPRFLSLELARGFYGQMNSHVASHLLGLDTLPDRARAERVVDLFLSGASGAFRDSAPVENARNGNGAPKPKSQANFKE